MKRMYEPIHRYVPRDQRVAVPRRQPVGPILTRFAIELLSGGLGGAFLVGIAALALWYRGVL